MSSYVTELPGEITCIDHFQVVMAGGGIAGCTSVMIAKEHWEFSVRGLQKRFKTKKYACLSLSG